VNSVNSLAKDFLDHPAAIRTGEELPLAALEKYLLRQFPGSAGSLTAQQFPSGHSNLTYLICLGHREMILRRPPFGSKVKTAHDMGREFRVLSKLHSAYLQAPHVLLFCDDVSILGSPFYLTEPIWGIILRKDPPGGLNFSPDTARRLAESFLDNLARLHGLDSEAIGLGDLGKPQGYLDRQVRGWIDRYYGSQTHALPEVERIAPWLVERMPLMTAATLIHNDYKYDNMILDPEDVTTIIGVLDWEMSTIGDPLSDLGTALAYWVDAQDSAELQQVRWSPTNYPGSLTRAQLVERYAQITGRDVSAMAFYLAFARFKVAVILQQIYYRFQMGLTQDQRFASLPSKIETLLRASLHTIETGEI
jgi:aminoglycoside phosphotransferase (APT) family kinase protein